MGAGFKLTPQGEQKVRAALAAAPAALRAQGVPAEAAEAFPKWLLELLPARMEQEPSLLNNPAAVGEVVANLTTLYVLMHRES
jgi:hypothetical protein